MREEFTFPSSFAMTLFFSAKRVIPSIPSSFSRYCARLTVYNSCYNINSNSSSSNSIITARKMSTPAGGDVPPPQCKTILSGNVARKLLAEVKAGRDSLDRPPHLVGFLANEDPGAKMYADWTEKTFTEK